MAALTPGPSPSGRREPVPSPLVRGKELSPFPFVRGKVGPVLRLPKEWGLEGVRVQPPSPDLASPERPEAEHSQWAAQ
jgi:hypothetical protein